jgi:hypothetical protein
MAVKVTGQFEPAGSFSIVDGKDISGNITGSNISGSGTGSFGTVGIGTNSPSAETKLHLYGNANADVKLKLENDFSGKNAVLVVDGGDGGDAVIHLAEASTVKSIITYDGGTDVLKIINDGSAASTHLAISSSGNVGIGTFSPNEKLEVVGNISASGYVYAQNIRAGSDSVYLTGATGQITASGNISSSGTIIAATASIGGGVFTSASLAGGGVSDYTQLSNIPTGIISGSDHVFTSITSSGNISASTTSTGSFGLVFSYKSEIQADGTNPAFLIQSASLNALTVNDEGILELGSFTFTPSATAGGMYYNSVDNEFYFGKT